MAHKYLIQRSDWFYFNKRIGNKVFRLSLQTRDIWTAKSIIKTVQKRIEGARVTIEIIKAVVQEEIDRVIDKATAMLQPESKQAKSELTRYFHSHFTPNSLHNNQLDNVPYAKDLPDRKPILNLDNTVLINGKEYVLDKLELKKYNQYKIEGNPIKEDMFLIWLENYQTLKYSIYINSSNKHLPAKIKSVA